MRATRLRPALAALVLGSALLTQAGPAAAEAASPTPQLSVTLKNSEKTVASGDTVTYRGEVTNLGDTDADLTIVLDAPTYLKLADSEGATVAKNQATWTATVATGKSASFSITATVEKIPKSERRVTTLASVYAGDSPSPVVRTANASFIDGVADTPGGKATPAARTQDQAASPLPWIIGGVVVLLLVIVAAAAVPAIVRSRRKRARRGSYTS